MNRATRAQAASIAARALAALLVLTTGCAGAPAGAPRGDDIGASTNDSSADPKPQRAPALDAQAPARWSWFDIMRGDRVVAVLASTLHLGLPLRGPLPDPLIAAIRDADLFVLEANRHSDAERRRAVAQLRRAMNGRTTAELVGAANWTRYQALLDRRFGPSPARSGIERQHPAPLVLNGLMAGCTVAHGEQVVWDDLLASIAVAHGRPIEYLETLDEQLRHIAELPEPDWPGIFAGVLSFIERGDCQAAERDFTVALAHDLLTGQVERARSRSVDYFSVTLAAAPLWQRMIAREAELAARIDARIRAGVKPFFVLGVAHLGGEDGVLARLRAAGYTITQH